MKPIIIPHATHKAWLINNELAPHALDSLLEFLKTLNYEELRRLNTATVLLVVTLLFIIE
jgi:hypothetical protein